MYTSITGNCKYSIDAMIENEISPNHLNSFSTVCVGYKNTRVIMGNIPRKGYNMFVSINASRSPKIIITAKPSAIYTMNGRAGVTQMFFVLGVTYSSYAAG